MEYLFLDIYYLRPINKNRKVWSHATRYFRLINYNKLLNFYKDNQKHRHTIFSNKLPLSTNIS